VQTIDRDAAPSESLLARPPTLSQLIMPTSGEVRSAQRRAQAKAGLIVAVAIAAYWGLVVVSAGLLMALACAAVLVGALTAVATCVMHDANHGSLTRSPRLNRLIGYSADLLGASSWMWRFTHNNLHHGNANVDGVDSDISQAPWARLAPTQPWRRRHRFQHIYMWFLYGFLTMKWLAFGDFSNLLRGRVGEQPLARRPRRRDVASMVAGKLFHLTWAIGIPLLLHPWWVVATFYVACAWLVGLTLALIFQLAHCVDNAEFVVADEPRRGDAFELHQLRTTVDVDTRIRGLRWLMGGLDHQIEHHLAPRLPHTLYPLLARRLRAVCASRGLPYHVHPTVLAAVRSHGRWLRQMGRPPAAVALDAGSHPASLREVA
jgi:linoleoyl-CoA desaturase